MECASAIESELSMPQLKGILKMILGFAPWGDETVDL